MKFDPKKLSILKAKPIEYFGLDVGSAKVKLVELEEVDGVYTIKNLSLEAIAKTQDSEITFTSRAIKAIKHCICNADVATKYAVCEVSGNDVAVRGFNFPALEKNEIANAIYLEAEQVCPFEVSQSVIDYQISQQTPEKLTGVFVAATIDAISSKSKLIKQCNLSPLVMDAQCLAILNCFEATRVPDPQDSTVILHLGNRYSNLIIKDNDNVPFVRNLKVAGQDIVKNLSQKLDVPVEDIEQRLMNADSNVIANLVSAMHELFHDINETTRYYSSGKAANASKLYLCGGFACIEGIDDIFKDRFDMDTEIWNPLEGFMVDPAVNKDLIANYGPAFVVATGLAMRKF